MEEVDAEADWNYDEHIESNAPLLMSQRKPLTEAFPVGLSFFSFENDHCKVVVSDDLPSQAESGEVFTVVVANNPTIANSTAYKQIIAKRSQPKKIRNAANAEVSLKAFICFQANSELLVAGLPFCCVFDNNPHNHRTVAPVENGSISCVDCVIGGRLAAEPVTEPTLFEMLDFRMHCFRMRAAAEPKPLLPFFDENVHHIACVLYRGFDSDCSEEDAANIVCILRFFAQLDYSLSALKLIKKSCVMNLLGGLFTNEYLDEEETKAVESCLWWMANESDKKETSSREQIVSRTTKLQVAVQYEVECSDDALDAINQSYESHIISNACSIVPRYTVLVSTSYCSLIDFACDYVPVHLINFPVAHMNGRFFHPKDPIVVIEAILNHDQPEKKTRGSPRSRVFGIFG
eukprot:gene12352-14298_t